MSQKMSFLKPINKVEIAGCILLVSLCVLPFFSFAGTDKIYVDDDASGTQNGSASHPYKTIKAALKHADKKDEVHILKGTYHENIEIPEDVKVFGSGWDKVTISGDDDEIVVKMNDDSEINGVTIKKGKYGVEVGKDDEASIIECRITDNDRDGIKVKEGTVDDKHKVNITDSRISNNGLNGIYSEKRRIIIMENEIVDNDGDGVELAAGSRAWIKGNEVKDNNKSGFKLTLDGSYIWTKNNTFYGNGREGVEINAFGGSGTIDFAKAKFYKNNKWGVARVQRTNFSANVWNGVTIQNDALFWSNIIGNVSPIIRVN